MIKKNQVIIQNAPLNKKEYGFIFANYEGECDFTLDIDEGDKGNFIVYDFKALYEIKLKNIYGNAKIDLEKSRLLERDFNETANKLTFLVPNFRTNSNMLKILHIIKNLKIHLKYVMKMFVKKMLLIIIL